MLLKTHKNTTSTVYIYVHRNKKTFIFEEYPYFWHVNLQMKLYSVKREDKLSARIYLIWFNEEESVLIIQK